VDNILLNKLLSYEFYSANKTRLKNTLFENEARDLYMTIASAHDKYERDISPAELSILYDNAFPIATDAYRSGVKTAIQNIVSSEDVADDVATDVIAGLWQRAAGTTIANLGLEVSEGNQEAFATLSALLDQYREGFTPDVKYDFTTSDTQALLETASDASRWKFNLKPLHEKVYGIGPAEFASIFATPNVGKTAMMVTLCFGPDGFADQGARVLYVVNEEKSERTKLRAQMCRSGMTLEEIELNPEKAYRKWREIDDKVFMLDIHEYTLDQLKGVAEFVKPDVIVIDQGDKLNISGQFGASHERLRELFRSLREFSKKANAAVITMSQASNEARGKTRLSPFEMEGSKIGKSAELDLIIGIGALESDGEPDMTRYLTIGKNKLNGYHGTVTCFLQGEISRYVV
jgi:archaellum biogenesis ATPase FlaH